MISTNQELGIYLHQKEVAALLGISPQAVSKIIRDHAIKTDKKGGRLQVLSPISLNQILEVKKIKKFTGVVGFHIVKGGVGKTTLVHGLGARAAATGHRTLLIDLDQQANLSHSFGVWPKMKKDPTMLNVYMQEVGGREITVKDAIVKITDFLHIIPANLGLANLDSMLTTSSNVNIQTFFSSLLSPILKEYDVILIDCPPALSKVTSAVHCFVDILVLPVNADAFSLEGLQLTLDSLKLLKKAGFKVNTKTSIVVNKFQGRHKITLETMKLLSEKHGELLAESFVSNAKKIENSLSENKCIWVDRSKNNALEDMHNLLVELFSMGDWEKQWKEYSAQSDHRSN